MRVSDLEDLSTKRLFTQIIEVDGLSQAMFRVESGRDSISTWVNRIHTGDCLKLMRLMPTESIGLIFTSPPYNLRNTTGGGLLRGGGKFSKGRKMLDGYDEFPDNMPHAEYVAWQRECLTEMMRLLRPDGAIFYNHKWRIQNQKLNDRSDIVEGFPVRQMIIWHRCGGINFNPHYFLPTYEVVYLIAKPDFRLAPGANKHGDVWKIKSDRIRYDHMCAFPTELARRVVNSTTAALVLDPFIGSGTTAVAAEECGRDWIGIEKSQKYTAIACDRVENARAQKKIF